MDLEERILKKNIPGKYSTWSADYLEEDGNNNNNDNADQDAEDIIQETCNYSSIDSSMSISQSMGRNKLSVNTGVKGVLRDRYGDQQQLLKEESEANVNVKGNFLPSKQQSNSNAQQQQSDAAADSDSDSDSDSFQDSDDEFLNDEFLQSYRQARISQIQEHQHQQQQRPIYKTVTNITSAIAFSNIIDETPRGVYCVIHLFHPSLSICCSLTSHFQTLANLSSSSNSTLNSNSISNSNSTSTSNSNSYQLNYDRDWSHVRFMEMEYTLVKPNMDIIGFLSVLVYCDYEISQMWGWQ